MLVLDHCNEWNLIPYNNVLSIHASKECAIGLRISKDFALLKKYHWKLDFIVDVV